MSPTKSLVAITAALGLLGSAATAFAQTSSSCLVDADCQRGYVCRASDVVNGSTPACPPDADCVPSASPGAVGNGGDTGSTITNTVSTCQPGPCTVDSDCATGMVCHTEMVTSCSGSTGSEKAVPPCAPDTKCESTGGSDPVCTTEPVSACTFKWLLPCSADADCGAGFACQPSIGGACSGGGGSSSGSGGDVGTGNVSGSPADAPLPAETCTTTMTYPGSCQPIVKSCATDTDCPSPWTCQDLGTITPGGTGTTLGGGGSAGTVPATGAGAASGSGSGAPTSIGAGDVAPTASTRLCVAPFGAPLRSTDGGGGKTGATPNEGTPTGSGGGTPTQSAVGSGGSSGAAHDSSGPPSADNSGGCSVLPASGGASGAALLVLAGLAMVVSRRRRDS